MQTSYKTLTFAILHMSVAFSVVWFMTGSWALGGAVALIEPAINTVAYFFHEKLWERRNGRRKLAPDSVRVVEYAESWEGRRLIYAIISAPQNLRNLDDIKAGMHRLRDPRQTNRGAAEQIIASQKPVTWLSYGVHGNEISSTDAAA